MNFSRLTNFSKETFTRTGFCIGVNTLSRLTVVLLFLNIKKVLFFPFLAIDNYRT